jgi:hypothetical protein
MERSNYHLTHHTVLALCSAIHVLIPVLHPPSAFTQQRGEQFPQIGWTQMNNYLGFTQFYGAAGNPSTCAERSEHVPDDLAKALHLF